MVPSLSALCIPYLPARSEPTDTMEWMAWIYVPLPLPEKGGGGGRSGYTVKTRLPHRQQTLLLPQLLRRFFPKLLRMRCALLSPAHLPVRDTTQAP